jgi:hypothetical protein
VWVAEVLVGGFGGAKAYQIYDELPRYIIPVGGSPSMPRTALKFRSGTVSKN